MNLASIDQELRNNINQREQCVGFAVYEGVVSWVIAWEGHYNLDHKKNLDAYLAKGSFKSREEYERALIEYRGGIPTLTHDLFPKFMRGPWAKQVETSVLRDEFFIEDNGQYADLYGAVENELSFNTPMSEDLIQLRTRLFSKLPKFYINYDRKIFMHIVRDRFYEKVVLDGWWGAECDFEHMIPDIAPLLGKE